MNVMQEVYNHFAAVNDWCGKQAGYPMPWVTMLYGSQNYGLDSADSDVDTKTMLLPSLQMILMDKDRISTEVVMADGSLDNCKDVREMFGNYLKGNINFVETLFTPYYHGGIYSDFFELLRSKRDLIANAQPVKLMHMAAGRAKQKYIAFNKPFEGKKEVLAKYGYDPKQLHHLMRLYHFMLTFIDTASFCQALNSAQPSVNSDLHDYLMGVKLQPFELEYAERLNQEYMDKIDELVIIADAKLPTDNGYEEAKKFLDNLTVKLLTQRLRDSL